LGSILFINSFLLSIKHIPGNVVCIAVHCEHFPRCLAISIRHIAQLMSRQRIFPNSTCLDVEWIKEGLYNIVAGRAWQSIIKPLPIESCV